MGFGYVASIEMQKAGAAAEELTSCKGGGETDVPVACRTHPGNGSATQNQNPNNPTQEGVLGNGCLGAVARRRGVEVEDPPARRFQGQRRGRRWVGKKGPFALVCESAIPRWMVT